MAFDTIHAYGHSCSCQKGPSTHVGEVQVHMMRQERDLLRRILIDHAQQMAETGDVSDNICSVARDLLQLLMQEQPADLQQLLHNPNVTLDDALFSL